MLLGEAKELPSKLKQDVSVESRKVRNPDAKQDRELSIGFEGRFDYAAIGTVSNVASRLCDEAKPGQILISPRVLTKVEDAVKVELAGELN